MQTSLQTDWWCRFQYYLILKILKYRFMYSKLEDYKKYEYTFKLQVNDL